MPSKRKLPFSGLERRVRPRPAEKWNPEPGSVSASEASQSDDNGPAEQPLHNAESGSEEGSEEESVDDQSGPSEGHDASPKVDISSISFGALARAQASLPDARKKSKQPVDDETPSSSVFTKSSLSTSTSKAPPPKRSSKHAPQEQTSKRPVRRMREIITDTRRKARDPRFDPLVGKVDESKARKAYAFLDEYRDSEMAELRIAIKKTKNPLEKEKLKRQLMSMESKKKAQKKKDEEEQLLAEHRQKEKELVAQGKTPFYLKRSEQKKQLLTNRYEKMSKGQIDRAIERKRKKVVGKEKKELGQLVRRR